MRVDVHSNIEKKQMNRTQKSEIYSTIQVLPRKCLFFNNSSAPSVLIWSLKSLHPGAWASLGRGTWWNRGTTQRPSSTQNTWWALSILKALSNQLFTAKLQFWNSKNLLWASTQYTQMSDSFISNPKAEQNEKLLHQSIFAFLTEWILQDFCNLHLIPYFTCCTR